MNRIILVSLSLLIAQVVCSQVSKDSVYKLMAIEVCDELKAQEASLKGSTDLQTELGMLMLPIFSRHEADLKKVIDGFQLADMKHVNEISHGIGQKLAFICPAFLKLIAGDKPLMKAASNKPEESFFTGTLTKILSENFTCLLMKDSKGKVEKFWWMQYFEGANTLNSRDLLNKTITVSYTEKEVYNAVLKEYVNIKVITGLKD